MKFIVAIIQPFKLVDVRAALNSIGVGGMTVTEVQGYGAQMGHTEIYRGAEYEVQFVPKIKVEVVLPDDRLDAAIHTIAETARTGKIGDGKIFVLEANHAIRIRTGEIDDEAI